MRDNRTPGPARPVEILQVVREGGGTASFELTVARKLRQRGHSVRVLGPASLAQQVVDAGFPFEALSDPSGLPRPTPELLPRLADRVLVLTSRAFDLAQLTLPPNVVHVGPQLDATEMPHPWHNPWPGDPTPLVLISLSTTDQGQLSLLKRLLAASGALPIHVLVTLGPSIDATQLHPPPNVVLERFVPHASVLPLTALVVSHAGHGTVIRAWRAGVPLVCLPMGRDQADVAMRVDRHGAGLTLSPDAHPEELRTAIERVLDEPSFRQAAQKLADELARESPSRVVDEIQALLSRA
jgi:MGT family glycosyltransferase